MIIGIDPGKKGGWCVMTPDGEIADLYVMPTTAGRVCAVGIAKLYRHLYRSLKVTPRIFVEKAHARPTDGKVGMSAYFEGYGYLAMSAMLDWPLIRVPPRNWCRVMHAGVKSDLEPKQRSEIALTQLFPGDINQGRFHPGKARKIHSGLMDATLIAEYGRRSVYSKH